MQKKKIASFTGLRFIMSMFIVLIHFDGIIKNLGYFGEIHNKYTFEFYMLALNFFLLLSGFGMMYSDLRKKPQESITLPSLKYGIKYAINHVKKIYPVYIGTIIFGIIAVFINIIFVTHSLSIEIFLKELLKIIINVCLLQSATCMTYFTFAYNGAAWFLSSLFCIYIISPFIIYILRQISKNLISDLFCIFINILVLMILNHYCPIIENKLIGMSEVAHVDALLYSSPYVRVFYVIIGMNIAQFVNRFDGEKIFSKKLGTFLEVIISIISILYYSIFKNYIIQYSYNFIIDMFLIIAIIFIFYFEKGYISNLLGKPLMQVLGNMAMYIYLIHSVMIQHCITIVYKKWGWTFVSVYSFIIMVLVITFMFSWLLYKKDKS